MIIHNLNNDLPDAIFTDCMNALESPGDVLLVPTETVYGLVCRWDDHKAVDRIYELKGREQNKPLALFVDSTDTLKKHGIELNENAEKIAEKFCPGPVTVVVPQGDKTVGFRIPDHPFMLELLKQTGYPLASTSANRSGDPNALSPGEALDMLDGNPNIIISEGYIPKDRCASTVVLAHPDRIEILREGPISAAELLDACEL
ncbi:L-threonylcarbamoyladenylate synthase [Lentisphaerota bacterium ZTH]|nr:threonylcarbamoyl-AMP synthase [Lentisphaerota bacterium]WET06109.1 L-threonylcarbamoyladenylate synthase [Lentisphaerota bacterium ZTH]